jgi:hypothetical protein
MAPLVFYEPDRWWICLRSTLHFFLAHFLRHNTIYIIFNAFHVGGKNELFEISKCSQVLDSLVDVVSLGLLAQRINDGMLRKRKRLFI